LRHDLPKSRLMDYDIWAGLSFLSMRFHRLSLFCRQRRRTSLTAFQARPTLMKHFINSPSQVHQPFDTHSW